MARRCSHREFEERIEVKPSVELIPDEFEHHTEDGSDIVIHAFIDDTEDDLKNAQQFFDSLKSIGYSDLNRHIHNLERNDFLTVIKYIQDEANNSNTNGLMLFFSCSTKLDGKIYIRFKEKDMPVDIQQIWTQFTCNYCKGLRNKPKIFIFEIRMIHEVAFESTQFRAPTYSLTYDTPPEADILVIYNKTTDETHGKLMNKLGKHMRKYGQREDIITLVSCIPSNNFRPMIISTLTKKFYFTPSEYRGHHYNLYEIEKELTYILQQMKVSVGEVELQAILPIHLLCFSHQPFAVDTRNSLELKYKCEQSSELHFEFQIRLKKK
ncbi:unnamed protein product [Acanthoscelides obtectus]|uniref:Peptidase C14A caspase catalytic domain-containing protein n=1 Tax=Acanthoscelides obtectus TaxID=200917 RepID=A0A9P0L1V9_ACAOB|nr:unnamed protein product [Acanthoscelides obtectus]CAK1630109.1 hypothetical protein AOBTE_LOCUS6157 [Acanthoscelides obtectus]